LHEVVPGGRGGSRTLRNQEGKPGKEGGHLEGAGSMQQTLGSSLNDLSSKGYGMVLRPLIDSKEKFSRMAGVRGLQEVPQGYG